MNSKILRQIGSSLGTVLILNACSAELLGNIPTLLSQVCDPKAEKYSGGNGSPSDPYKICTGDDLALIADRPTDWAASFQMLKDIDASGVLGSIATNAAPFTGHFDGQGHRIVNLNVSFTGDYGGLFAVIAGGTVENLILAAAAVDGQNMVGGIAGELRGNGTIRWVVIEANGVAGVSNLGGVVGKLEFGSNISEIIIDGLVASGANSVGGVVGHSSGNIRNIQVRPGTNISAAASNAGGIAGLTDGGIVENVKTLDVSAGGGGTNAGSIAGHAVGGTNFSHVLVGSLLGTINGAGNTGAADIGVIGSAILNECYYPSGFIPGKCAAKTAMELQDPATYGAWPSLIWWIPTVTGSSQPYLRFTEKWAAWGF